MNYLCQLAKCELQFIAPQAVVVEYDKDNLDATREVRLVVLDGPGFDDDQCCLTLRVSYLRLAMAD